ncbi:PREDICTED: bZIP transcription factor 27-like [Ipomoea nil]|uniref:bZIP transcription factor 27-like n=1 Tax=Ipomoea nil TaxID=35883 RepID=UPI00090087B3|nr:PREDICTED: bZIP transcription factor 27-like [Ipomoea nil]
MRPPFNGEDAYTFSSSSSSPSPFSPSNNKTMEEVWKDINLSSLHHHSSAAAGINFQDFLARPFAKDQPPSAAPIPDTMLNLNSVVPDLHFLQPPPEGSVSGTTSFEALASSASAGFNIANGLAARNCSRLVNSDDNSGDRRHKRMIKNRESAARSRARKQAYTNQLEQEVTQLAKENCRLKKQLQQLSSGAAGGGGHEDHHHHQLKKGSLSRTSTAPF